MTLKDYRRRGKDRRVQRKLNHNRTIAACRVPNNKINQLNLIRNCKLMNLWPNELDWSGPLSQQRITSAVGSEVNESVAAMVVGEIGTRGTLLSRFKQGPLFHKNTFAGIRGCGFCEHRMRSPVVFNSGA